MSNKINRREIKMNWIENPPKMPKGENPASTGAFFLLIGVHERASCRTRRIAPTKNTEARKTINSIAPLGFVRAAYFRCLRRSRK
jgi:hypothetical protein